MTTEPVAVIQVFCCYSRKDQELLENLKAHLAPLRRQGLINIWNDTDISPGTNYEDEIKKHLDTADVILLLISPDFMNSDYCYSHEMKRAMERHNRGEATVVPIILRPVHLFKDALFGKIQALPTDAKPVRKWDDPDDAFFNITRGIHEIIEKIQEERQRQVEEERQRQVEEERQRQLREQQRQVEEERQRRRVEKERQRQLREEQLRQAEKEQISPGLNYHPVTPIQTANQISTSNALSKNSTIRDMTTKKKKRAGFIANIGVFGLFLEIVLLIFGLTHNLGGIYLIIGIVVIITTFGFIDHWFRREQDLKKELSNLEENSVSDVDW